MSALERIAYSHGDTRLTGWVARPAGKPRAGIVIYPTIVNVNQAVERYAAMLADEGYLAFYRRFLWRAGERLRGGTGAG